MIEKKDISKLNNTWISIVSNQMLRDSMKHLIEDFKKYNVNYESFASQKRLYLHIINVEILEGDTLPFNKVLDSWTYFYPIRMIHAPKNISEIDKTDW